MSKCKCEICEGKSIEEIIDREDEWMKKCGWYAHIIQDDKNSTGFNYHTHGLPESHGHPDIQIVLPINPSVCHKVVSTCVKRIKEGEKMEGEKSEIIGGGFNVRFIPATENDRDVVRLIFPDSLNRLDGFEEEAYALQLEV